jgi:hypothetical protein
MHGQLAVYRPFPAISRPVHANNRMIYTLLALPESTRIGCKLIKEAECPVPDRHVVATAEVG